MFGLFFVSSLGCAHTQQQQPKAYPLESDYYEWVCHDYEDVSEVEVETVSCDDDILYIVSEVHLTDGKTWKQKMDPGQDCLYTNFFPLYDDYCISLEGVTVTAWAN